MALGWLSLLAVSVLILSDSKDIGNMNHIAPSTQFFWDSSEETLSFHEEDLHNKRVLIVVHGFNTSFDHAIKHIKKVNKAISPLKKLDTTCLYDVVIGYVWPAYNNGLAFPFAAAQVHDLKERLQYHLLALREVTPYIDVIAHSLGNRLLLEALNCETDSPLVQNFYSLAPAVNSNSIEINHSYYTSVKNCKNFYVFHSNTDGILKNLYPLTSGKEALGINVNPNLKKLLTNMQFIDCSEQVGGHSDYFYTSAIYRFIEKSFNQLTPSTEDAHKVLLKKDGSVKVLK